MRSLLSLAIALYLGGVPLVAAQACSMRPVAGHECCFRHGTEAGGPTIGYCCCKSPSPSSQPTSAVSTAAGSLEKAPSPVSAPGVPVTCGPAEAQEPICQAVVGPGPSPPPLTAVGLRC